MQKIPEKLDVLLVQRADTSFFPPTINQANILARSGLRVGLLDGCQNSNALSALLPNVALFRPLYQDQNGGNRLFIQAFRKLVKEYKPSVCVAFDVSATVLLGLLAFKGKKVFQYHEHPGDYYGDASFRLRIQNWLSISFSKKSDLIIIPDSYRASVYYREERLNQIPSVVRNCPVRLDGLPIGGLKKYLERLEIKFKWVVLFQGGVSSNLYADLIVESMPLWPENSLMVFIGPVADDERKKLDEIIQKKGLMNRVVFLGQVPYAELFSYTVDADLALTMIKPVTFNYIHMAGASNKRYDVMACGIPQVSNVGPGMKELIEDNRVGICVDPDNPENIGNAVSELLLDPDRRQKMSKKARELHQNRFNYEQEFAPILNRIQKWCRDANEA